MCGQHRSRLVPGTWAYGKNKVSKSYLQTVCSPTRMFKLRRTTTRTSGYLGWQVTQTTTQHTHGKAGKVNEYPANYPRHGFHICSGCGNMAPHHTQENSPDNGWSFDINTFGYYGGFTDNYDFPATHVTLCHDCVLKMLNMFPLLGIMLGNGCHSMFGPKDKPCCKYAWKAESIGDASITWVATEDGESWTVL